MSLPTIPDFKLAQFHLFIDAWLRAADNKKAKKEEKISKLKLKRVGTSVDSSMNALAAAGFNLGRQYSWTNTSLSGTGK